MNAARRMAGAVRSAVAREVVQHARDQRVGTITRLSPLRLDVEGIDRELDAEEVTLGSFADSLELAVGDNLVVVEVDENEWIAVEALGPEAPHVALGGRLTALEARNHSGTGSPEGAVVASPGATYQQTDGANGATHWIKETGAGSAGWRRTRRIIPVSIDLYGPQSQEAFALVGTAAAAYAFPGSALSASTFEMYAGMDARVRYAMWHVVWTPGAFSGVGIELVKFDPGPSNIVQVAQLTGLTGGPRNDSALITNAVQTIIDGIDDLTIGVGPHKQIGHRLKGDGTNAAKVYMSRVSILFEV